MSDLMSNTRKQAGFGHIVVLVLILVFIAIGAIGYKVYQNGSAKSSELTFSASRTDIATAKIVPDAPQVKSIDDIDASSKVLDQADPTTTSSSDLSALNSQFGTISQ